MSLYRNIPQQARVTNPSPVLLCLYPHRCCRTDSLMCACVVKKEFEWKEYKTLFALKGLALSESPTSRIEKKKKTGTWNEGFYFDMPPLVLFRSEKEKKSQSTRWPESRSECAHHHWLRPQRYRGMSVSSKLSKCRHTRNSFSKFDVNSTGHFKIKSSMSSFHFGLFSPMKKKNQDPLKSTRFLCMFHIYGGLWLAKDAALCYKAAVVQC